MAGISLRRVRARLVMVVGVIGAMLAVGAAPARADVVPAQMTLSVSTGLVDLQGVSVELSGGTLGQRTTLRQCAPGSTPSGATCEADVARTLRVGGDTTMSVYALLHVSSGTVDCRVQPASSPCQLAALDNSTGAVVASAPIVFDPAAPLAPPATITATPATGLLDGQTVHTHGAGAEVGNHIGPALCKAGAQSWSDCHTSGRPPIVELDGTVDRDVTVYAVFTTIGVERVDCRVVGACEIVLFSPSRDQAAARTSIVFDAHQMIVEPTLTVTPSTGLRDRDTVTVTGHGFDPYDLVDLWECTPLGCTSFGTVWGLADATGSFTISGLAVAAKIGAGGFDCRTSSAACTLVGVGGGGARRSARAALTFRPSARLAGPADAWVVSARRLTDGQVVHVDGVHFWPGEYVSAFECPRGNGLFTTDQLDGCVVLSIILPGGRSELDGQLHFDVAVHATFTAGDGTNVDCRTVSHGCVLAVVDWTTGTVTWDRIRFAEAAPAADG